jgi:hypothetical protein
MEEVKGKGTYISGVETDEGTTVTTEKGFTFTQETGEELAFDVHDLDGPGTALLFGNQIFFLSFWTDEQLDKASTAFAEAVRMEKGKRNDARSEDS